MGCSPGLHHTWGEEADVQQLPVFSLRPLGLGLCFSLIYSPISGLLSQPWPDVPAIVKANMESQVELPGREQRK